MAAEIVDTLELEISTRAEAAKRSIESLATSVADFGKTAGQYADGLETLGEALERIVGALNGVKGLGSIKGTIGQVLKAAQGASAKNVAAMAAQAKAVSVGKAFKPAIPPVVASREVKGRTRYVQLKGGGVARFDKTADEVAQSLMQYEPIDTKKGLSERIQSVRQKLVDGAVSSAMEEMREIADDIATHAGNKRISPIGQEVDRIFGKSGIYVAPGDRASVGALSKANKELAKAGLITRLYGSEGNGRPTFDDIKVGGFQVAEEIGHLPNIRSIDDLVNAVTTGYSGHNSFMGGEVAAGRSEAELAKEILSILKASSMPSKVEDTRAITADATRAAREAAERARAEQAQIQKEEELAWRSQEKWDREQWKRYKEDVPQRVNWKEVERSQALYEAGLAGPDRTAEEIAGWKEMEAVNDHLAEMKQAAEGIVQANTVGGAKSAEESMGVFIQAENEIRDMLNRTSAALQEAVAPTSEMEQAARALPGVRRAGDMLKQFNAATGKFDIEVPYEKQDALFGATAEIKNVSDNARDARREVADLVHALNNPTDTGKFGDLYNRFMGIGAKPKSARESMDAFMSGMQGTSDVAQTVRDLNPELAEVSEEAEGAQENVSGLRKAFDAVKDTVSGSWLGKLTGQLMRVAKMRALRYVVRAFASGVKEGINNMYQWSKATNGAFASSMDTISTKFTLAKNSLATAFAPALNALVPIVSTVVSWVNAASNAIAQLLALLGGQSTWTKATESATEFGDATKKAAGGGSSAMKDLLADWDELNIIQSQSGGGGGGGGGSTAANYADMFEEMSVFDEWTKYFDEIKAAVIAIGAGIAGRFVIGEVENFLGKLGIAGDRVDGIFQQIRKGVAGAVLLTIGFSLASASGKDIANNGLTPANALSSIGGAAASALGGRWLGGAIGTLIGGPGGGAVGATIGTIAGLAVDVAIELHAYFEQKQANIREKAKDILFAEGFEYDVDARLEIVNTTIENVSSSREQLRDRVTEMLGTIDAIKLGIADAETEETLRSQISDVVATAEQVATDTKNFLKLRYQMVPALDENGNDISSSEYMRKSAEWDSVSNWFAAKGKELGELIVTNEKGQIEFSDEELAQSLIDQINKAVAAVTKAQIEAEASMDLNLAIVNGADAEIPKLLDEYKQKITGAAENMFAQEIQTQQALVDFYKETGNENYEAADRELKRMLTPEYKADFVDRFVSGMMSGTTDKLREYYLNKYGRENMFNQGEDWRERLAGYTPEQIVSAQQAWETRQNGDFWSQAGIPGAVRDFMQNSLGITEFSDLLSDDQKEYLATLYELADTYKKGGYAELDQEGEFPYIKDAYEDLTDFVNNYDGFDSSEPVQIDTGASDVATDGEIESTGADIEGAINDGTGAIERVARSAADIIVGAINSKDLTVNITPSAMFGRFVNRSGAAYGNITGVVTLDR